MKKEAIVDRIEGKKAVLITDDEETVILPAAWLPDIHEGMAVDMDFTENPEREKASMEEAERPSGGNQKDERGRIKWGSADGAPFSLYDMIDGKPLEKH